MLSILWILENGRCTGEKFFYDPPCTMIRANSQLIENSFQNPLYLFIYLFIYLLYFFLVNPYIFIIFFYIFFMMELHYH